VTAKRTCKRKLTVGVSDATHVKSLSFNVDHMNNSKEIAGIILASTSMPSVFPYVSQKERILIDGGVLLNVDVASAVKRCKEIVDREEDIILDVIMPTGA
jgi:predicted acylesterase/phospholipase RssA